MPSPTLTLPAALVSLPPATRALTGVLIAFSSLLFVLRLSIDPRDIKAILGASGDNTLLFPWLLLLPGKVAYYPWTLITASAVETNLIEFLISLLTLPLAGRYLERVWGQAEFLKFVLVTVVVSNIIAVVVNWIEATVLGDSGLFLYGMTYHGLQALQVGFLVAFTQLIPEHQVQIFGGLAKVRVKSLPMLYVTVSNVACLIGYQSPYILIQFGWLVSWFYLRFIKLNEGGEFRGDRSETFAFSSWFPPFAQKYVARVAGIVFNLAIRFKVIKPWTDIESGSGTSQHTGTPGGARAEAERRRAMALKALDQRMATSTKPSTSSSGSGVATSQTPSPRMATVASMAGQPIPSSSGAGAGSVGEVMEMHEGGDLGKGKEKA